MQWSYLYRVISRFGWCYIPQIQPNIDSVFIQLVVGFQAHYFFVNIQ